MSDDEPVFYKAPMEAVSWAVRCPVCNATVEVPEVEDDDAGVWFPADEHCIVECNCGAHIEPYGAIIRECRETPFRAGRL